MSLTLDPSSSPVLPANQTVRLEAHSGWQPVDFKELWRYRELLGFLAMRDVKVRYKQTVLGIVWIVLQPLLQTGIFSFIFGSIAQVTPKGVPATLFIFSGMVIYQLFARAIGSASNSLVNNAGIIKKVYFPRLIYPIAPVLSGLVDFFVGLCVYAVMLVLSGIHPSWPLLTMPLWILWGALSGLSFGLGLAALNVMYRDIGFLVPFLVQIWMYVTPVVFDASKLAEKHAWALPILWLNPLTAAIEGFRWATIGSRPGLEAPWTAMLFGLPVLLLALLGGLMMFKRMEKTFADVV